MIRLFVVIFVLTLAVAVQGKSLLIPMDETQTDHLKAYGIAFKALEMGINVEWLLNYRAGSFALVINPELENLLLDPFFKEAVINAQAAWRRVVVKAVE